MHVAQAHPTKQRKKSAAKGNRFPIEIDPSVLPILTKEMGAILFQFVNLVQREAEQNDLAAGPIEVRGSIDLEDDTTQVIVRLWHAKAPDQEVQRDYRLLCTKISSWLETLGEEQRQLFNEQMSFHVRVSPNAKVV